ncbi:unnamed protein product [Nippostrongylus brasiliensis]|uniref:RNA-directed RNA polymerase n=1 Tax=Nippostrongylus brasiliensis TaxID=27835 RepID=A0A158R1K6_NIPBR|nr:unnamed protein product [Nippostrongylus brasiliensis]
MADTTCGRVKLEVPHAGVAGNVRHAVTQAELFRKCLMVNHIHAEEGVETSVEEPGCEKFLMYSYDIRVEKGQKFSNVLLPAIRKFFEAVKTLHMPGYMKATVIVHSQSCFSNHVISAHRYIPLTAVYFGNFQGGYFINHWEISFRDPSERRETNPELNRMHADFLYDQNEFIIVSFYNKEFGRERKQDGYWARTEGIASYEIALRLNFVRRIVVDNAVCDKYGKDRTRIHFELNCPAIIRRGFLPESKDTSIYAILSRLRLRTEISIEFSSHEIVEKLYHSNICPYATWTGDMCNKTVNAAAYPDDPTIRIFLEDTIRKQDWREGDGGRPDQVQRQRKFSMLYLLEALFSRSVRLLLKSFKPLFQTKAVFCRGAVVKDQLLLDKAVWIDFLKTINFCYRERRDSCIYALERVITMIDERKRIESIVRAFIGQYEDLQLVITQTRVIYVIPETIMANRVLREHDFDGTTIIRVAFRYDRHSLRDDDNQAMRTSKSSKKLIESTLRTFLKDGFVVADRSFGYLGSSNSQMRDSGAYFMEKSSRKDRRMYKEREGKSPPLHWQPKIDATRNRLGRFTEMESIPKLMARLGQCFTQSRKTNVPLRREEYATWHDFIGGSNQKGLVHRPPNIITILEKLNMLFRKEYTFSDGVGMISKSFAAEIAKDMGLGTCVPSCFQIRFRGMKGVVAVNPYLDELSEWANKNEIKPPEEQFGSWNLKVVFRPSQKKFNAMRHEVDALEIVKYSSPVPVSLNKPFICILDQVSEMQSYECHRRVTNRIEELLDLQLRSLSRAMLREHECRNKLKELPRRIDIDRLSVVCGFQLSTEPFFRSLIKATIKFVVNKQMRKQQIQIPYDKGRVMLGVVDETGQLQYGQVFVQYTENINLKTPPPNASRKVLTGKVLLTKNPCIVAGDVRVFEAVDIPDLRHLSDVVVFPMHGPRPHPDEMAGSDLDGDEYAVIWDQDLLLERNEAPFDYTADKPQVKPIDPETMNDDMVEFYITYITKDSVGTISNSFLFQADLYGINSEVCLDLAKKISQAVDFTKTGLAPEPLRKHWTESEETGKEIPPEKSERQPDFHFGNDYDPVYRSPRLMGKIYRKIKVIEDVLKTSEDLDEQEDLVLDSYLSIDGWLDYKEVAEIQLAKYKGALRAIMENYGIKSEGEIFSGCISNMRNRISDRDQDDMSFYNTNEVIETKMTTLFRDFREEFFMEFGGWKECTRKMDKKFAEEDNIFHRLANHPSEKMKQKAIAYYIVCYTTAQQTKERILSFAWIPYDVLAAVRQDNVINEKDVIPAAAPLYDILKERIDSYVKEAMAKFINFCNFEHNEAAYQLKMYTRHYPGIVRVMFIVSEWAERNQLLTGRLQSHHICLVLILYATGLIPGSLNRNKPFIDKVDNFVVEDPECMHEDQQVELFLGFFEYLASRDFQKLPHLSFDVLGYSSVFLRGEWLPLHDVSELRLNYVPSLCEIFGKVVVKLMVRGQVRMWQGHPRPLADGPTPQAAVKTYYNMVFNLRFDELNDTYHEDVQAAAVVREMYGATAQTVLRVCL